MPGLTEAHFQALGRITTAYAALEAEVTQLLWKLVDEDERVARVLTYRTPASRKLHLLRDLAFLRLGGEADDDDRERIRDIIGEVKSAISKRNKTVHAAWLVVDGEEDPVQWTVMKKQGTIEGQILERDPQELNAESLALGDARDAIFELRDLLRERGVSLAPGWLP